VGSNYAITATAGAGFVFSNWTGGTSLPLSILTNGESVQFVMVSNLVLQANFVYTNPPIAITNGMVFIPAGPLMMGDVNDTNIDGDAAPTGVSVSAFYMDANLVSYSHWQTVCDWTATNGYVNGYEFNHPGAGKAANHPVQMVDWYDAVKWCNARSQMAGLSPVYYTDSNLTQVYMAGETDGIYVNWTTNGYRLPTEAEWEKAARGGFSGQRFPWGNQISEANANYFSDTNTDFYDLGYDGYNRNCDTGVKPYTSPVGSFATNGYGLYDMAGNVYAWCWDWYGTPYAGGADPHGPSSGTNRVARGGGWDSYAFTCRTADRSDGLPGLQDFETGFRTVMSSASSGVPLVIPLALSAPRITVDRSHFMFHLSGPAGGNYVLQVSTNLVSWGPVSTSAIPVSGTINLTNENTGCDRRFYRIYLP
jgi:formylglycine-generating enzyme required for sulfatase activity